MIIFDSRASIILYNVLNNIQDKTKIFLLPLNVCPIVPATFIKAKVPFEFVDITNDNLCIDELKVYEKLQSYEKYGGLLFVKTFGIEYDAEHLYKKLKSLNSDIFIIDDRCLCKPDFNFKVNQSNADLVLFSTGYSKYVDIGWGGFAYLKEQYIYKTAKLSFEQKDLDQITKKFQISIDTKQKLEYIDTQWLGSNKKTFENFDKYKKNINQKLEAAIRHKSLLNKIYINGLPENIILGKEFNNWRFNIIVDNKDILLKHIFDSGLFASSHYASLEYMFGLNLDYISNASALHLKVINLFNDFRFDVEKAKKLVELINIYCEFKKV